MRVPEPLRIEQEELHREFAQAIQNGGRTGAEARIMADLLHQHFLREERLVRAPLAELPKLVEGETVADAPEIISMAETLKAELLEILVENKAIRAGLERLAAAASEEGHQEIARLAERLRHHTRIEEDVLYPAAVLVGEFLKRASPPGLTRARWPERTL